jgi:hypothetical protein
MDRAEDEAGGAKGGGIGNQRLCLGCTVGGPVVAALQRVDRRDLQPGIVETCLDLGGGRPVKTLAYEDLAEQVQPLLVKHGFALSFSTEPAGERLLVRGLLEGYGHERTTAFPLPAETSGSKNNVQGWGSSMSYGKRYCTIALLNIISEAPEDRDTDGEPNRGSLKAAKGGGFVDVPETIPVSEAQVEELKIAMEDARVSETNFCKHFGIQKVADLPADLFSAAKKQLADHKAKYQKGPARG